jgi:hypothetical protein
MEEDEMEEGMGQGDSDDEGHEDEDEEEAQQDWYDLFTDEEGWCNEEILLDQGDEVLW